LHAYVIKIANCMRKPHFSQTIEHAKYKYEIGVLGAKPDDRLVGVGRLIRLSGRPRSKTRIVSPSGHHTHEYMTYSCVHEYMTYSCVWWPLGGSNFHCSMYLE
jgi:hypothetical protein